MEMRKLGRQGLGAGALGLGCMGLSFAHGGRGDGAESIATIHLALELGVNFLDTAEIYGPRGAVAGERYASRMMALLDR
jgi:aryl-alcohol dehydrogenase-like predicted oxidoreductase